jgi:hypothetical protein
MIGMSSRRREFTHVLGKADQRFVRLTDSTRASRLRIRLNGVNSRSLLAGKI